MDLALSIYLTEPGRSTFDPQRLAKLIRTLGSHGLLPPGLAVSIDRRRAGTVDSGHALAELALQWPARAHVAMTTPDKDYEATITLEGARCAVDLFFLSLFVTQRADHLLSDVGAALRAWMADDSESVIERHSGLSVRNLIYQRLRPARTPLVVGRARLVDLVDLDAARAQADRDAVVAFRDAALPDGARRHLFGSKMLVEWATDCKLGDDAAIRCRLAERDRWLIHRVGATLERDWNSAGDIKYGLVSAQPHLPLTLLSPVLGVGYKAIHAAESATEIEATLRQVSRWIADQRLDDGTELSDVVIIADSRASALALRAALDAAGIKRVVYTGEDGQLWDPYPDGEWFEDESGATASH